MKPNLWGDGGRSGQSVPIPASRIRSGSPSSSPQDAYITQGLGTSGSRHLRRHANRAVRRLRGIAGEAETTPADREATDERRTMRPGSTTSTTAFSEDRRWKRLRSSAATGTRSYTYTFENFFHPFVGRADQAAQRESLPGLMDPEVAGRARRRRSSTTSYHPHNDDLTQLESFPKEIDVSEHGPYANYNWELFFHVPLTIAVHLSKNQRFAEAQRWFHYIFDPTSNDTSADPPKRFWKFLAFRKDSTIRKRIDELLALLSKPEGELTADENELRDSVLDGYAAILNKPFQPHAVARTRHARLPVHRGHEVPRQPDRLGRLTCFSRTRSRRINEATQLYVLAANILGPRPQQIPPRGHRAAEDLRAAQGARLGPDGRTRMVELEGQFPFNSRRPPSATGDCGRHRRRSSASGGRCTSASRATTSCSATGTRSPTGCSRSATA